MFVGRKGRFFLMLCLPPWYSLASLVSGRPAAFFLFRKLLGTSQGRDLRRGSSRDEGNECFLSSFLGESWLGPQSGGRRQGSKIHEGTAAADVRTGIEEVERRRNIDDKTRGCPKSGRGEEGGVVRRGGPYAPLVCSEWRLLPLLLLLGRTAACPQTPSPPYLC